MGEKPSKKDLCQRQGLAEPSQREGEGNSRYIKNSRYKIQDR